MPLKIQTTGIEQYAAGGEGRLQVMIIGGPGAGKTRFSSYWPKPIYANCEAGLASIADRKMPFVDIKKSQDMLDLLSHLALECRRPYAQREYQTVVIDTLDAFQRTVKDEWLKQNPGSQSFRGFDAWGYLDAKMQMLLTRLLNLDMNVIVLAHYKDKTIKEGTGENATERQELMLQLSGEVKDSVFNDFDLVGWMGTYWDVEDGERVLKRGLTFERTPDRPFLKDRLHVTPKWMEVRFADSDYTDLFAAVTSRLDEMSPSETVGEIESAVPESMMPTAGVVSPASGGGPLEPVDPKDVPLAQYDKVTLQKMARDLGLKLPGNTIKAEYILAIENARAEAAQVAEPQTPSPASDAGAASPAPEAPAEPAAAEPAAAATPAEDAPVEADHKKEDATGDDGPPLALEDLAADAVATPVVATEVGNVDPATGEIKAHMSEDEVAQALGGTVLSVTDTTETEAVAPPAAPAPATPPPPAASTSGRPDQCEREGCGKPLAGENQDFVKLSQIKYRMYLCNDDYVSRKKGEWSP